MSFITVLWRQLTRTKALDQSSGELETAFFESVYRIMYLTGLSSSDHGWYLLYSNGVKIVIGLFVCSELWYLFSESANLDGIIENINVTLIHLIAIYRYWSLMKNREIYKKLSRAMQSPYFDVATNKRKELIAFWMERNESYFKLLLSLGTCTLIAWYIYPLVDDIEYNLTVAVRLPFSYRSPTRYALTYITVIVGFHYVSYFVIVNDLIMQAYLMHLLCQYAVLADGFENILSDCSVGFQDLDKNKLIMNHAFQEKFIKRLGNLVNQHQFILTNTLELRRILNTPMLFQFAASSMLICFAGYQVATTITANTTKFLMSLLYLGYNMFELFIFCRWCDEIKIQGEYIREAVYSSGWEGGIATVPGVRARLILVIARASKPLVLSAGGLYDLSLHSYTTFSRMDSCHGLLSVLRSVITISFGPMMIQ